MAATSRDSDSCSGGSNPGNREAIIDLPSDGLAEVIARHPQVERLISGHIHRPITARFAGTVATTCPSTAHQIALDLAPDARDAFVMEPPAFQLHRWDGRALVTHTVYVDAFDGPHPFSAKAQDRSQPSRPDTPAR